MNDKQFKTFLELLMVSDPWPLTDEKHRALLAYANAESGKRGYDGWIHAYHEMDDLEARLPRKVAEELEGQR